MLFSVIPVRNDLAAEEEKKHPAAARVSFPLDRGTTDSLGTALLDGRTEWAVVVSIPAGDSAEQYSYS